MDDAEEPQGGHVHVLLPGASVHARLVPHPLSAGPQLAAIDLPGAPARWVGVGFSVHDDATCDVGTIRLRLDALAMGLALRGIAVDAAFDGLPARRDDGPPPAAAAPAHPNGAIAVDHVVVATPDLDRTVAALATAGLAPRRVRETGRGARQAFFVVGDALLEVVGPVEPDGDGPASFWGLTLVVADLDAAAAHFGEALGSARDAVQAGRRIATVRREAELGTRVALMTPRP